MLDAVQKNYKIASQKVGSSVNQWWSCLAEESEYTYIWAGFAASAKWPTMSSETFPNNTLAREVMQSPPSTRLFPLLNGATFDLDLVHMCVVTIALLGLKVKIRGQKSKVEVRPVGPRAKVILVHFVSMIHSICQNTALNVEKTLQNNQCNFNSHQFI